MHQMHLPTLFNPICHSCSEAMRAPSQAVHGSNLQHHTANLSSNLLWSSCNVPYTWDMLSVSEGQLHCPSLPLRVSAGWGIACYAHGILLISSWGCHCALTVTHPGSAGQELDVYLQQSLGRTDALVKSAVRDNTRQTL